MLDSKDCEKKQYNMEPYFNDEDEKLIKQKNKINNMIMCDVPLLEKKIKIEENDLKDFRPLPKKQKCKLNCLIVLGMSISIITLTALVAMAIMIARNDDVMCVTAEMEEADLLSDNRIIPGAQDAASKKHHEPIFIRPSISKNEGIFGSPIRQRPKKLRTTTSTTTSTTTQRPVATVTRNNERDCNDGMYSYSIFPDINICANHKEVNTEDVAWAVEDCMDLKGHLPKSTDMDELNYISGLVKDLTRMNHPSPILVKREAKPEDYGIEDNKDGVSIIRQKWMLFQPANGSLQMDSASTNQVGVLCIKPFDEEDAGFFGRMEESMIEMMKTMRERVANIFSNSPFFRHQ